MHICIGKTTIIGSDNGLSPGRRQAIIWTNAAILLIGPLGTNFSEILIGSSNIFIQENALEKVICEMAAIFPGLNVLIRNSVQRLHTLELLPFPQGANELTSF